MGVDYRKHLRNVKKTLEMRALLFGADLTYVSGWPSSYSESYDCLLTGRQNYLFTWDYEVFKRVSKKIAVRHGKNLKTFLESKRIKELGIRKDKISYKLYQKLSRKTRLIDISEELKKIRSVKDTEEIKAIKKACSYADKAMGVAMEVVREGVSERKVRNEILHAVMDECESIAFEPIVASGRNSLYIHILPEKKKIKKAETVIVDIGFKVNNYCSDLSRTFIVKPSKKQKELYEKVLEAQNVAMDLAYPGVKASEISKAVDDFFQKQRP